VARRKTHIPATLYQTSRQLNLLLRIQRRKMIILALLMIHSRIISSMEAMQLSITKKPFAMKHNFAKKIKTKCKVASLRGTVFLKTANWSIKMTHRMFLLVSGQILNLRITILRTWWKRTYTAVSTQAAKAVMEITAFLKWSQPFKKLRTVNRKMISSRCECPLKGLRKPPT